MHLPSFTTLLTALAAIPAVTVTLVSAGLVLVDDASTASSSTAFAIEARTTTNTCPPEAPIYRGWFDPAANLPPQCLPRVPRPGALPRRVCPAGQVPYCARDPGNFCPYDPTHAFCLDDGRNACHCLPRTATADEISRLLAAVFCLLDRALSLLGLRCLLSGGHHLEESCPAGWTLLDLGCTLEEIGWLVAGGVQLVLGLVGGLLSGVLGGGRH